MLVARDLSIRFGGVAALQQVSLTVEARRIVGLIGPNGAGKTTFLNSIAGTYRPNGGKAIFDGQDTTGLAPEVMCHRGMARTFQIPIPFPKLSVLDNVMVGAVFGAEPKRGKAARDCAEDALEFVHFPVARDTHAEHLNAAQLKRLDLARALACSPKLLLLDELASGLTPSELADMMALIREIRDRGISIIVVEHIMQVIKGICERIFVLQYGTKIAEGTTDEVLQNPLVIEAYLGTSELGH